MKHYLLFLFLIFTLVIKGDNIQEFNYNINYGTVNMDRTKFQYSQFVNEFSGIVDLDDELKDLKLDFKATNRHFYNRNQNYTGNSWDTDFNLNKRIIFSDNLFANAILGFKYGNADDLRSAYFYGLLPLKQINGHGYELYFGSSLVYSFYGQQISFTPKIVYYEDNNLFSGSYKDFGTKGYGGDFDLNLEGVLLYSKYGLVTYRVTLDNHLRKPTSSQFEYSNEKNSVYLNYITLLNYSSPKYYGFSFDLSVINQWERFTGDNQKNNGFYVAPKISYTHTFDLNVGKLTINPFVSYNVVDKQNRDVNIKQKGFDYKGNKELMGGIQFKFNGD